MCTSPSCLQVVNKSGIPHHLKKKHRLSTAQLADVDEILSLNSFDAVNLEHESWATIQQPVQAIQGLPVFNGFRCIACRRSFGTSVSILAHQRVVCRHLLQKDDDERFVRECVQCVHVQAHAPFFPVFVPREEPHADYNTHRMHDFVLSNLAIKEDLSSSAPQDSRFNKSFLNILGWIDYFADKDATLILQVMQISAENEVYSPIFIATKEFFLYCMNLVNDRCFSLLEKLGAGNK